MALIEITTNLTRVAKALERIADILEEHFGRFVISDHKPPKEGQFFEVTQADHYEREQEEQDAG